MWNGCVGSGWIGFFSDFYRVFFYWVSAAGATVDLHWANEGAVPSWNGIVPSLQLITLTESFTGFF